MTMRYDVDYEFVFEEDEFGTLIMPENVNGAATYVFFPTGVISRREAIGQATVDT